MQKIKVLSDGIGFVSLVDQMVQDSPLKVVNSARISYNKSKEEFDESDKKLCGYLFEHGHTSPYRHTFYTFHLKMPLFTARQFVKYQVGSFWRTYECDAPGVESENVNLNIIDWMFDTDKGCTWNEVSGRYAKFKAEFYYPKKFRGNLTANKQESIDLGLGFDHSGARNRMIEYCENAYRVYESMLEEGIAREIARMILPQNIYTEAYWTVSLQGVIHFLKQRLAHDSQNEIRKYADAIFVSIEDDLKKVGVKKRDLEGGSDKE